MDKFDHLASEDMAEQIRLANEMIEEILQEERKLSRTRGSELKVKQEGHMQRAFLYGFGSYVVIGIIITVNQLAQQHINPINAVIIVIIYGLLAFLFFQVGKERPPNKSWLHAVGGWLLGFASALIALYGSVLALYYILYGTLP
jgi:hypothetical protein